MILSLEAQAQTEASLYDAAGNADALSPVPLALPPSLDGCNPTEDRVIVNYHDLGFETFSWVVVGFQYTARSEEIGCYSRV